MNQLAIGCLMIFEYGKEKMKRYRIKVLKYYEFDLDGKNKKNIQEQLKYILDGNQILEKSSIDKHKKVKISRLWKK